MTLPGARWKWIAAVVVLSLVAGLVVVSRRDDSAAPPPTSSPAEPSESTPAPAPALARHRPATGMTVVLAPFSPGPARAQVGQDLALLVQVSGIAPITAVELWAGSERVVTKVESDRDDPTLSVVLEWRPGAEGTAMLLARAVDGDGRSATSNPLTMTAVPAGPPLAVVQYTAVDGDTLRSVAQRFGVAVEVLVTDGGDPDAPLRAGLVVGVPQVQLGDDTPPEDTAPRDDADAPPASMPIAATAGCRTTIDLSAAGVTDSLLVRAGVTGSSLDPIDQSPRLGENSISFVDVPLGPGPQLFAVETTSGDIRSTSPPVLVEGDPECGGSWEGSVRVEHGLLLGVPDDIEEVFLFVGTGGAWQRVPASGQDTLPRAAGGFDLRADMPDVAGAPSVEIEVWGWRDGALVDVARSLFRPETDFDPTLVVGRSRRTSLSLIVSPPGMEPEELSVDEWVSEPGVQRFRWSSGIAGTSRAIWQVLTFAPTPNTSPMTAGVVAEGELSGSGGTFGIDLGAIVSGPPEAPELTSTLPAYAQVAGPAGATVPGSERALPPGGAEHASELSRLDASTTTDLLLPPLENIHVRVIPMVGDHWPGSATNNVLVRSGDPTLDDLTGQIDLEQLGEPINPDATPYDLDATILPPTPPNPGYLNCWQFVRWDDATRLLDFTNKSQYEWWDGFLQSVGPSTPLCPGVCYHLSSSHRVTWGGKNCGGGGFSIPIVSDLGAAAVELWDLLIAGISAVKGFVVDAVVELSFCREVASQSFCKGVATLAVNAVPAAYGIPPSLPNSDQLRQIAKGELRELVIEAAQDMGVPCAEIGTASDAVGAEEISCDALVQQAIDEVERQVGRMFAQAAQQSAGISFPRGAIVQPAPQGQTSAPVVTMTLTPTTGAPQIGGLECTAQITMLSSWTPPQAGVPFASWLGAAQSVPDGSPVRLPNWQMDGDIWAVPRRAYDGFVSIQRVELPTDELAYQVAAPSGTETRTYFPALSYSDPVDGALLWKRSIGFSNQPEEWTAAYWATIPNHALQLHPGASFVAEIYSPCTGLYRYENPILGLFSQYPSGTFEKIP